MSITAKDLKKGVWGKTEAEVCEQFEKFLRTVEADGFKIVPTVSTFADYIKVPRISVYEWLRVHKACSESLRQMCADTIAMGAMLKKYVPSITNLALKNWCGWEEAPQKKGDKSKEVADEKKATEKLDAYIAENRQKFKVV